MDAFLPYAKSIAETATKVLAGTASAEDLDEAKAALDGRPSAELRATVPLCVRRAHGAFFTGAALRQLAIARIARSMSRSSVILDPACGAGDLLLEAALHLGSLGSTDELLTCWGSQLRGWDLHVEFIQAARARLTLLAASTQPMACSVESGDEKRFPYLRVGDALKARESFSEATHIVLNPPYGYVQTPDQIGWTSGKVNVAAVFLDSVLRFAREGTAVVAILPDVLRTGSRYARFRQAIGKIARIESVEIVGQFDATTDVDVFILHAVKTKRISGCQPIAWVESSTAGTAVMNDHFAVSVGTVVPHRDKEDGESAPYITASSLEGATDFNADTAPMRSYGGRRFTPPFIVIRRTSRPDSRTPASSTMVRGTKPVSVENHLLVLMPRREDVPTLDDALTLLGDSRTVAWLHDRIRCRHLTVSAIREIPWINFDAL